MASVDIKGIDKMTLLQFLWSRSANVTKWTQVGVIPEFDMESAKRVIAEKKCIDYFHGASIKTDISKDTVDPSLYDRDNGKGAFEKIVSMLRNK
jgi:hypothetical protein